MRKHGWIWIGMLMALLTVVACGESDDSGTTDGDTDQAADGDAEGDLGPLTEASCGNDGGVVF